MAVVKAKEAAPTMMETNLKPVSKSFGLMASEKQAEASKILYAAAVDTMRGLKLPNGVKSPEDMVAQLVAKSPFRNEGARGTKKLTVDQYAFVNDEAYRMGKKQGKKLDPVATAKTVAEAIKKASEDSNGNPAAIVGAYLILVAKNHPSVSDSVNEFTEKNLPTKKAPSVPPQLFKEPEDLSHALIIEPTVPDLLAVSLGQPSKQKPPAEEPVSLLEMQVRSKQTTQERVLTRAGTLEPKPSPPPAETHEAAVSRQAVTTARTQLESSLGALMTPLQALTPNSQERLLKVSNIEKLEQLGKILTDPALTQVQANAILTALETAIAELEKTTGKRKGGFLGGLVNRLPGVKVGLKGGISAEDRAALAEVTKHLTAFKGALETFQAALWLVRANSINDILETLQLEDKISITVRNDASGAFSSATVTCKRGEKILGTVTIEGADSGHFFNVFISVLNDPIKSLYRKDSETEYTVIKVMPAPVQEASAAP